eukprot:CAMPEP_0118706896 /NCGR_PEP_ID=MMETSP0800-20121206/20860_1 /TAXON_ID=210618 ORGANISM="Striatella unipunctata, Strain CCMP2910" /NCGR_SAMPLE_ID=MMETSP0800 /ASSEMBLY_ACC=CAM_ASM_000638 /LENGTH=224 /DNA_ID=CAMNT_0006609577 /DNA_START=311 /DNA_END=987 /DNA_ORIENTATION=-
MIKQSSLMHTLLSHPNVDEVLLLHSNPNTAFEFVDAKVTNVDARKENDEMGLSVRFYFCQLAKNDWVIHVDDDMEFFERNAIEFNRNSKRIVGRYGRNLSQNVSSWFSGYSRKRVHGEAEVILTKLLIAERNVCRAFFEYGNVVWDDIVLNSADGPLWNGEDIFFSLVANHMYENEAKKAKTRGEIRANTRPDRNNFAMDWLDVWDAPDELKNYDGVALDIVEG